MKVAAIREFGGPEVLVTEEVSVPVPGPGQVRLRVEATTVNPIDVKTRRGQTKPAGEFTYPMILGWDVAGIVESVGEGVRDWKTGARAVAMSIQLENFVGTYAEYVVLDSEMLAPYATSVEPTAAATLPLAGLTAHQALRELRLHESNTLFINGALGAVGGFATQLSALEGVKVIAAVSEGEEHLAYELGAASIVNRHENIASQIEATVLGGVDAAMDVVGGLAAKEALAVVRDGGRYATVVPTEQPEPERNVRPHVVHVDYDRRGLLRLAHLLSDGKLTARVSRTFGLEEASVAHASFEASGLRGKIVMVP